MDAPSPGPRTLLAQVFLVFSVNTYAYALLRTCAPSRLTTSLLAVTPPSLFRHPRVRDTKLAAQARVLLRVARADRNVIVQDSGMRADAGPRAHCNCGLSEGTVIVRRTPRQPNVRHSTFRDCVLRARTYVHTMCVCIRMTRRDWQEGRKGWCFGVCVCSEPLSLARSSPAAARGRSR